MIPRYVYIYTPLYTPCITYSLIPYEPPSKYEEKGVGLFAWVTPPPVPRTGGPHLDGQGDLVSGLILGISRVITWVIGVINLLSKSP